MALTMYESVESRNLKVGPGTSELPIKFVVMGSDDHAVVWNAVLLETVPTLFGLTRTDLQLDFKGGGLCFAELSYTSADPSDALQPEGGGGGDGNPGGGDGGPGDPGGELRQALRGHRHRAGGHGRRRHVRRHPRLDRFQRPVSRW